MDLIRKGRVAQEEFEKFSQGDIDKAVSSLSVVAGTMLTISLVLVLKKRWL